MNLNIGCGNDYRKDYVNIDGSDVYKVDKIINLNEESLLDHFEKESVDHILCKSVLEHYFRWEACNLLKDFFALLKEGGAALISVPDTEYVINMKGSVDEKIIKLYGGQNLPVGMQAGAKNKKVYFNPVTEESRKKHPEFFCHKYGWTPKSLSGVMKHIGFSQVSIKGGTWLFAAHAKK